MKLAHIFCIALLSSSGLTHSFSYDSAVYAAQKGKWEDAQALLNSIMVNHPDDAPVLYDAGVAEYNLGNAHQAAACFVRAAECAHDNKDLRFRSYFNAGNAYVDDKNLKVALEQYDKALAIEPDNEPARHNRDRVAQMLQEQDKQDKKNNDQKDDQEKDDKNENQDNKDKQQKDQNGGDDQPDSGKDDQSGDGNDQDDQNGDQKKNKSGSSKNKQRGDTSEQESHADQGDNADGESNDTKRKEHGNQKKDQEQSAQDEKRNGDQQLDKKTHSAKDEGGKQQGSEHNQAPEKQNEINNKTNVSAEGGQEQAKDDDQYGQIAINDPWLLNVLNNQELRDKAMNKQLMEAKIRQHGGKNVQNCW